MSCFLLWQKGAAVGIGAEVRVLPAADVPLLADAHALCARLNALHDEQAARIDAAARAAREQARGVGLAEGRAAARDEAEAALATLARALADERTRLRESVAALALAVARKLVGSLADGERIVGLAGIAARDLMPTADLALVVAPDLADVVRAALAAPISAGPEAGVADDGRTSVALPLRVDPDATPGTWYLDTGVGTVDASLDSQLDRLASAWGVEAATEDSR